VSFWLKGMFAIIANETTDVIHKEQLCVSIRWVGHDFKIYETPIQLIYITKIHAETISSSILECLENHTLPISQCQGQAYDGAANMSGHLQDIPAHIEQVQPNAIMTHCLAHCTNLYLQSVSTKVIYVREALDVVKGISNLIHHLPKQSALSGSLKAQVIASTSSLNLT